MTSPPKSLFRYFGHSLYPQEKPEENSGLKLLDTLTLKLSSPSQFNDPLEFNPMFLEPISEESARLHLRKVMGLQAEKHSLPTKLSDDLADVILELKRKGEGINYAVQQTIVGDLSERFGVICFCGVPDQPLMWAHYAAQHFGVMIEFDGTSPLFQHPGFVRVEYEDNRYDCDFAALGEFEKIKLLARRKCSAWKHEEEYRLVIPLSEAHSFKHPSGRTSYIMRLESQWIKSITIGNRASVEMKNEVIKLLKRQDLSHLLAARYRMVVDAERFCLRRQLITSF